MCCVEEADASGVTLPPQAVVAYERMRVEGELAGPQLGERVSYIVGCGSERSTFVRVFLSVVVVVLQGISILLMLLSCCPRGSVGARLADRCVEPMAVYSNANDSPDIDRSYYVEKVMAAAVGRVLFEGAIGLPPVDLVGWLREVPRPSTTRRKAKGPLGLLLRRMCSKCRKQEAIGAVGVCQGCASELERAKVYDAAAETARQCQERQQRCIDCAGEALWHRCSGAGHCPRYSQRRVAEMESDMAALQAEKLRHGDHCGETRQACYIELSLSGETEADGEPISLGIAPYQIQPTQLDEIDEDENDMRTEPEESVDHEIATLLDSEEEMPSRVDVTDDDLSLSSTSSFAKVP
eukprot:5665351-Amphidinium_carterae.2